MASVNVELSGLSEQKPIIKVIGVGGGGGNAVNHMYDKGICDVDFVICNTDKQALEASPIPIKVQLGERGLGAGNKPEVGAIAATESLADIQAVLQDSTEMVFITAGMGGGTGTGAAPIIAQAAKDMGILTIGIVTIPFLFEGKKRVRKAIQGVEEMRKHVDAILVVNTERINDLYADMDLEMAFNKANDVLAVAAKGIAELITIHGTINVDLEDVKTVMKDSGDAVMGAARCSGDHRAVDAIKEALNSPLLQRTNLEGARNILLNISYSREYKLGVSELQSITNFIEEQIDTDETETIWGITYDDTLGDAVNVTIVATGFNLSDEERYGRESAKCAEAKPKPMVVEQPVIPQVPIVNIEDYYGRSQNAKPTPQSVANVAAPSVVVEEKPIVRTISLDGSDDMCDRIESQPAYMRKRAPEKSIYDGGEVSTFSLSSDGGSIEIKDTNSFIHNQVD